jgi:hypothetical protein
VTELAGLLFGRRVVRCVSGRELCVDDTGRSVSLLMLGSEEEGGKVAVVRP